MWTALLWGLYWKEHADAADKKIREAESTRRCQEVSKALDESEFQ